MIQTLSKIGLILALATLAASPAFAQQQQRQQRFGAQAPGRAGQRGIVLQLQQGGLMQLLDNQQVKEALKLTEAQIEKIQELAEELRDARRSQAAEFREELQNLAPQDRRERFMAIAREMESEASKKIEGVLESEQFERLTQIQLQRAGVLAFAEEKARKALSLTEDQIAEIDEIIASYRTEIASLMQQGREGGRQAFQQLNQFRRESMQKALSLLNDDQRAAWRELIGEPFQPGPGARRGQGLPGGRRPGGQQRRPGGNQPPQG